MTVGRFLRGVGLLALLLLTSGPIWLFGQSAPRADAEFARAAYDKFRTLAQASPYRNVPWQYLGPTNVSGRATDVAVADSGTSRRIIVGYATSGVWTTDDNGATWRPV